MSVFNSARPGRPSLRILSAACSTASLRERPSRGTGQKRIAREPQPFRTKTVKLSAAVSLERKQ
eukprot:15256624-Alexandrium_andersonii.AAC.1